MEMFLKTPDEWIKILMAVGTTLAYGALVITVVEKYFPGPKHN